MKAKIIRQTVYEGLLAKSHGLGEIVERLVVIISNNLVITPHNDRVYAFTGFNLEEHEGGFEIVGEVDVPGELVEDALAVVFTRNKLDSHRAKFKDLIKEGISK